MSDYTKTTDFADKDGRPTGDPLKVVKGTELDDEFNDIEFHMGTKADSQNAVLTGTTTAEDVTLSGTLSGGTIDGGSY